jgi:hypothetical protein
MLHSLVLALLVCALGLLPGFHAHRDLTLPGRQLQQSAGTLIVSTLCSALRVLLCLMAVLLRR